MTFSAKKGHVYRISTSNLNMDTSNYTAFATCVIKDQGGSEVLNESLNLDNGYVDYKAAATGTVTMYLNFEFKTDASFDISYSDVTCTVAGHPYGKYTVTKKATVTSKGKEVATCTVCGEKTTKTINYKTGVAKASDGKQYYLKKGVSQNKLTAMVKVNGMWYYVQKGVISFKKTGIVEYKNQLWYVKESTLDTKTTGIVKYGSDYVYVQKGKCDKKFTGIVSYGKDKVYVENGFINFSYLGEVTYKGKTYNIRGGYVV
jgi:hypothetical protein